MDKSNSHLCCMSQEASLPSSGLTSSVAMSTKQGGDLLVWHAAAKAEMDREAGPAGPRRCGISVPASGSAGLRLPQPLRQVLLNPGPVALLRDQPRNGGDVRRHLEGATEGLGEGRQLRG